MQIFQRIGDEGGVLHGFADGAGFGGTEISGLDPLALRGRNARRRGGWTFVATIFPAVIAARVAAIIPTVVTAVFATRFTGLRRWFRRGFDDGLVRGFSVVMFFGSGGVRSKFCGRFAVRHAEAAGIINLGFGIVMLGGFGGRRDFIRCIRRVVGCWLGGIVGGRFISGRARPLAAATATATATAAVGGGTPGRCGRLQIRVFVWHKFW